MSMATIYCAIRAESRHPLAQQYDSRERQLLLISRGELLRVIRIH